MMIRFVCAATLLATVVMTPAMSKDKGTETVVAADKKICKREAKTGSIMPRPVCRTRAEWDAMSTRSQVDKDRFDLMDRSRSTVGTERP